MKGSQQKLVRVLVFQKPELASTKGSGELKALQAQGFKEVSGVRVGQLIELRIDVKEGQSLEDLVRRMCNDLLCNSVTSTYDIEIVA